MPIGDTPFMSLKYTVRMHKSKTKLFLKSRWPGIFVIAGAAVFSAALITYSLHSHGVSDPIGKVNGEPISLRLFQAELARQKAETYAYFHAEYGAEDSENFWTSAYDGEVPVETARQKALDEVVRTIVQQKLAKEKGLVDDISYGGFLNALKKENRERKEAIRQNKVIYGPVEYSEDNYFNYVMSNLIIKLKSKLAEKELAVSDLQAKEIYEFRKDTAFRLVAVRVQKISLPFGMSKDNTFTREQARSKIEELLERLKNGGSFEELSKEFNRDRHVMEQTFDENSKRSDMRKDPELRAAAINLNPEQISGILETADSVTILRCIAREEKGYKNFEEVKDSIKTLILDENYNIFVDKLVREARVDIDRDAYERIHE